MLGRRFFRYFSELKLIFNSQKQHNNWVKTAFYVKNNKGQVIPQFMMIAYRLSDRTSKSDIQNHMFDTISCL